MTTKSKFALLPDWQRILKQAWSIRLTLLAVSTISAWL